MKYLIILLSIISVNALAKPVNVNSADAKTIAESLSGIGMKKAEDIVRYRTANGPYKTKEDLIKVKGIGEKTVQKTPPICYLPKPPLWLIKKLKSPTKAHNLNNQNGSMVLHTP